MIRNLIVPCTLVAALGMPGLSPAASLEIQLVDVDIEYDATTGLLTNSDTGTGLAAGSDSLSAAFFFVDDTEVDNFVPGNTEDLALSLVVPDVFGIPITGGSVLSSPGGTLDILLPTAGSSFLELDLDSVEVIYTPVSPGSAPVIDFVFAATVGDVASQNLPLGLLVGESVSVTLSTQASDIFGDTTITSFTASGTGEIIGDLVPEPAAAGLLLLAMAGFASRRAATRR